MDFTSAAAAAAAGVGEGGGEHLYLSPIQQRIFGNCLRQHSNFHELASRCGFLKTLFAANRQQQQQQQQQQAISPMDGERDGSSAVLPSSPSSSSAATMARRQRDTRQGKLTGSLVSAKLQLLQVMTHGVSRGEEMAEIRLLGEKTKSLSRNLGIPKLRTFVTRMFRKELKGLNRGGGGEMKDRLELFVPTSQQQQDQHGQGGAVGKAMEEIDVRNDATFTEEGGTFLSREETRCYEVSILREDWKQLNDFDLTDNGVMLRLVLVTTSAEDDR